MTTLEKTVELQGARYVVRKMTTRGYLALMDLLGRRPAQLAEVIDAARSGRREDAARALGPVLGDVIDIVLAHCVRPFPDTDALAPRDAQRLLAAARELNPLPEIADELNRFFEVIAPVAGQARNAIRETMDGSG